ncbi:two-component system sensor histidine kinase/response regulator [Burkholderia sp. Leaf177]|uniref:response regulator n=1 Tax=Burkholderia sp. Leaf177 TaxID=1736287 RepID=UPI0006FBA910|nr:response regulator [Burkholderia sp. Leaf177]KQR73675.1 two-component system sensor histidine kinase/response regulator [Burkholderia sp. Leaf177]
MPDHRAVDQNSFRRIIRRNIALPLSAGIATAAVFVALLFYLLSAMSWLEHSERVIGDGNDLIKLAVDRESGQRGFLLTGDDSFLAPYQLGKASFNAKLSTLMDLVGDNPPQVERLKRIEALQAQWERFAEQTIAMRRANQDVVGILRTGRGKLEFDETRREFKDFMDVELNLRWERAATARQVTITAVAIFLAISLSLSAMLAVFGRRELMKLSETYDNALQAQAEHNEVLHQQAWLRTGQSQLAESLVGQQTLPRLGRAMLDFLSQYLGVVVAALYVRDDSGKLRRVAAYGFSRENEAREQFFENAETLVGQVAESHRLIELDDIPDNYLKVTSGLGTSPPKSVVMTPIDNDGAVNGVIELGLMQPASARELDFLRLISASVGASVEAALYRERLQDVLAETQQLNEELQVQQEELRSANEELEEQTAALEESQSNLNNQKAELETINEQLTFQALTLDEKNEALNKVQTELEARAEDLQRASRYKSEFLANMSHELRTPLNSSLILAKLLSENHKGNLSDEQVKFANTIYSAGNDLLNLINDILDISKVEAGKLELAPEDVSLSRMTESLLRTFEPLAGQKRLAFTVGIEPGMPASIFTDSRRLEQILKNLISNALKFTETGAISLTLSSTSGNRVRFAVTDTGIGIAPENQQTIFEAFRQADGTTSRRYGGTGLGLSISRDLAKLLGGTIRVTSALGAGSTFELILPVRWTDSADVAEVALAAPPPAPVEIIEAPLLESAAVAVPAYDDDRNDPKAGARSVLVIEDDVDFAGILYNLAHEMRYRCLVAQTAAEAMQLVAQHLPDAILLDISLPDRSGLMVLQQLKDGPQTRHIPVHVVSANDSGEAALHLGAIGYALKPTTRDQLKDIFRKLEDKFTQKVKRVLLVEDDARQRESIVQLIGDDDIDITAVEFGEEALALLRTTIFDCMIIDLKLPDMQGGELLQRMSGENMYSFPPVIVYTGRNLTHAEEADLLKYSRSIIIKGARSPERLLDEVTLFLHKVETDLSTERQTMLKTVRGRDRVFEGRRILLVDDDIRNIFSLSSALEHKGMTVDIARNGFEAIDQLNDIPDIDLVLMDVMMPAMDGLEATRRIRADARFKTLPIIAITAKAMKDDQEQARAAGMTDYLAKPIDLDRLYSLLRVWLPGLERIRA